MGRRSFLVARTSSLGVLLAVWPLAAQVSRSLTVHVPFSFVAAEKTLPAGEYTVTTDTDGAVLNRSPKCSANWNPS